MAKNVTIVGYGSHRGSCGYSGGSRYLHFLFSGGVSDNRDAKMEQGYQKNKEAENKFNYEEETISRTR